MPQRQTPNADSPDDRVRRSLLRRFGRILGVAKSEAAGVSNGAAKSERQTPNANSSPPSGRPAFLVAAGNLLRPIAGLIRGWRHGHFPGSLHAADYYKRHRRIPNNIEKNFWS